MATTLENNVHSTQSTRRVVGPIHSFEGEVLPKARHCVNCYDKVFVVNMGVRSYGDDVVASVYCPRCTYLIRSRDYRYRSVLYDAGEFDQFADFTSMRRALANLSRITGHKYRDHGLDQHINGNAGSATNSDDTSFYSKSDHNAYGHTYSIVAVGPPHSLVFQSFLDGDLKAQPLATETTKRICIQKTEAALKPAQDRTEVDPGTAGYASARCKKCGAVNNYVVMVIAMFSLLTTVMAAGFATPMEGIYSDCGVVNSVSGTLFTVGQQGPCEISLAMTAAVSFSDGPTSSVQCLLALAGSGGPGFNIMGITLPGITSTNEINALPATLGFINSASQSLVYRGNCAFLAVATVSRLTGLSTQSCCSLSWSYHVSDEVNVTNPTSQPVPVNVVTPLPLPVNVTEFLGQKTPTAVICTKTYPNGTVYNSTCIPTPPAISVNVTAILGQVQNPATTCSKHFGNGTISQNYTCIEPKLLQVLPPDTASGPSYLGRPQTYSWSNFSEAVYPNFDPYRNTSSYNGSFPAPPLPQVSKANQYTPDMFDLLANVYNHLRRKLLGSLKIDGYSKYLADSNNQRTHASTGNSVQIVSDEVFQAYCMEAARLHGSIYHYVFNHLAFDEPIPEEAVRIIADEQFSTVDEKPASPTQRPTPTRNNPPSPPAAASPPREPRQRTIRRSQPVEDITATKIQYDRIVERIASKIQNWDDFFHYILRNADAELIHLQRIYHRLKFLDDGSAQAGFVCLHLRDEGASDLLRLKLWAERAKDLHIHNFSCPLIETIHACSSWESVCAEHRNQTMHTLVGNGNKDDMVIIPTRRRGSKVAPPHVNVIYTSASMHDAPHLLSWLETMSGFDAYYMVGHQYAVDSAAVLRILDTVVGEVRVEAYFRLRGGNPPGDDEKLSEMLTPPTTAPLTPAPSMTGNSNRSATLPKDGVTADDEKSSDALPSAEILTQALANTFAATTRWSDSLFYTTVNSLAGLLTRYAQSIKLTSSLYNNVGYKSCMNNYGMYFARYMVETTDEGATFANSYTSVDPSGPGNTTISYTQAGQSLVAAIATNDMLQVSQNLRIQTVPVNGTALYQAMTDSRNVVSCGLTGSFSSVFYRIFANMYSLIPMVGTEHSPLVGNSHLVLPSPIVQGWETQYWPLSQAFANAPIAINTMICTYSEFTGGRFGNLLFSQPQFGPNGYAWGNTTAVVPITLDMLNGQRGGLVAAWILAHMEYPYRKSIFNTTMVDDINHAVGFWDGQGTPAISNSRCRGPIQNVLLVVSGLNTVNNALDDFTVQVGVGGGAVAVTYNANFAVGPGGVQVDISAGLDSIYQNGVPAQQLWLETLNTAYQCYGNESDVRTALLMVADSGTRIAPPAFTATNLNVYGYYLSTAAVEWNQIGLTRIFNNTVDLAGSVTCPLNMATTSDVNAVRNLSMAVCRIGQFNPLIAVDMVNGMYRPSIPPSQLFPQSTAAIASCISRLSRMLTVSGDAALRATGLPMNYLFNPAAARALSAGNVNVLAAWRSIYDGINKVFEDQGISATYLGSWFADFNPQYWIALNQQTAVLCAVGRVPSFYMKYADIQWNAYCPELARTMPFGEYDAANFGYPNAGDPYERIMTQAPEQSKDVTAYDILSRLSPMFPAPGTREPLAFVLMTKGGGDAVPVAFAAMYPSVGRSPALTLQNYGIITWPVVDVVDPPVDGTIPVFNPNINNEVFPGFYGPSYGYYTRVPQVKYNKHEIANGDLFNYTIIQNASGAPSLQNRLNKLSGRQGN